MKASWSCVKAFTELTDRDKQKLFLLSLYKYLYLWWCEMCELLNWNSWVQVYLFLVVCYNWIWDSLLVWCSHMYDAASLSAPRTLSLVYQDSLDVSSQTHIHNCGFKSGFLAGCEKKRREKKHLAATWETSDVIDIANGRLDGVIVHLLKLRMSEASKACRQLVKHISS